MSWRRGKGVGMYVSAILQNILFIYYFLSNSAYILSPGELEINSYLSG